MGRDQDIPKLLAELANVFPINPVPSFTPFSALEHENIDTELRQKQLNSRRLIIPQKDADFKMITFYIDTL